MNNELFKKGIKYEIFIGLKDKDTYDEILNVDSFIKLLSDICTEKQISFSLLTQFGGYPHNKGYTTETSLRVIIIGINEEELILLGVKLKEMINTDTILITKTEIEYSFM
ncbi:MAG: hypothetical protein IKO44_02575 [Ruminococcus sp.]|nr:hypothetical protein [Ruminococcus sp.]